jgi:hypothetical protein
MDSRIIAALIGAGAAILSTLISVVLAPILKSRLFRARQEVPDILGTWRNEWSIGKKLYVTDTMKIEKWIKDNQFQGTGYDENSEYKIQGQIDSSRILVATYRDIKYPKRGHVGVFILELAVDGQSMKGYWHGVVSEGDLKGGLVSCERRF